MAGYDIKPHSGETRPLAAFASAIATVIAMQAPALAQQLPAWQPLAPQYVQCPAPGQPLLQIPEIISQNGKLRGTIVLGNNAQRMFVGNRKSDPSQCLVQEVRQFRGSG